MDEAIEIVYVIAYAIAYTMFLYKKLFARFQGKVV